MNSIWDGLVVTYIIQIVPVLLHSELNVITERRDNISTDDFLISRIVEPTEGTWILNESANLQKQPSATGYEIITFWHKDVLVFGLRWDACLG